MNFFHTLTNRGRMAVLGLLLILLLPLSFQCIEVPTEVVPPSWTTELTIPLMDRIFYFGDQVNKDSKFDTLVTGEVIYRPPPLENQPSAINIPGLEPYDGRVASKLGLVPLDLPSMPPTSLSFLQLTGQKPPDTVAWPGPEMSITTNQSIVTDTMSFDYIIFDKGLMKLTVTNTYKFGMNFTTPILIVDTTIVPPATVASFEIGMLNAGETKTSSCVIDGKRLPSAFRERFSMTTVGLTGKSDYSGSLDTRIDLMKDATGGQPTLDSAKVRLTGQYSVGSIKDSVQKIDDSTSIKRAEFSAGGFTIRVTNGVRADIIVEFKLDEFRTKNTNERFKLIDKATGKPVDLLKINGRSTYEYSYLMKDYAIQSVNSIAGDTLATNTVTFSLNIKTLVETADKRVISKLDSVVAEIIPFKDTQNNNLPYVISKVTGKVKPTFVSLGQVVDASANDVGNNYSVDSIRLDNLKMVLKIFTKSGFPTDLYMSVTGLKNGVPGPYKFVIPKGTGKYEAKTPGYLFRIDRGDTAKIIFDKNTPGMDRFLAATIKDGQFQFPYDQLKIEGSAVIDPVDKWKDQTTFGYVENGDSVYTIVEYEIPVSIGIKNGMMRDTLDIAENIDTAIVSSIYSGRILFNVVNTFPLDVSVTANLLKANPFDKTKPDTNAVLISFPQDKNNPGEFPEIRVPGDTSITKTGSRIYTWVQLRPEDAIKLGQAKFTTVAGQVMAGKNNGSTPLPFRKSDYVHVKIFGNVKFNVDYKRLSK